MAANPFWDFSLALYGKPGATPALLGLQDRVGLDVNLLLYACWAGSQGRVLSAADLAAVEAAAAPWQAEIVRPLRALRRRLKGGFPGLAADAVETWRKRLGELEIEA
ncbi:MAG: TIGR02444 family protein, partial [Dongiaceae bacterium]